MLLSQALAGEPSLLVAATGLLGLIVGSFLNVVVLRLPPMLERSWLADARHALRLPRRPAPERFSLVHPPSRCPHCRSRVRARHNVPVLSWIFLRGRCADCGAAISPQYPLVELLSALAAAACAWRLGWSPQLAAALPLTFGLIALAAIDLRTQLLPDVITLPLLWLGLLLTLGSPGGVFCDTHSAVIGAAAGYLALWIVYWLFKLATGKDGMGYGDFKLLAALGAWLGWQGLPAVILLSSAAGAVVGLALIGAGRLRRQVPMPFGPFLAAAGWIALLWGDAISRAYLSL